jgi:hypothetical protein
MLKVISTLGLLLITAFGGCDLMRHTHCDDEILSVEKSPDQKHVAILYHRSCANNSGLYTCVNLQEGPESVLSKGEIQPILTIKGFHKISAIWTSANTLEIKSPGLQDHKAILTQESSWKTVSISYPE